MLRSKDIQLICLCLLEATGDIQCSNSIQQYLFGIGMNANGENHYCLFCVRLTFGHLDFEIILVQFD